MMHPMKSLLLHLNVRLHRQQRKATEVTLNIRRIYDHLILLSNPKNPNHQNKLCIDLHKLLQELHFLLYGDADTEPRQKACTEAALEFFKDKHNPTNTFRLLLKFFTDLERESKTLASQVIINLLAQTLPSSSLLISADYFEDNMDLVDLLVNGLFDNIENNNYVALMYRFNKFLHYVTCPNYTFAVHMEETLELLLTRHKTTMAQFLLRDYEWFFEEFNKKILGSSNNQLIKTRGFKMLKEMLLEGKNHDVKLRYMSNVENLKVHMNGLRETSKWLQLEAFHVFDLFVENPEMPKEVTNMLWLNKTKLVQFIDGLKSSRMKIRILRKKRLGLFVKSACCKELTINLCA